jgi:hypothetical protein
MIGEIFSFIAHLRPSKIERNDYPDEGEQE